ncbi:MAG: secretin N-terminal domain-containing protein [Phycisphaerales bacterium]|jgi:general secretion pathway protein D
MKADIRCSLVVRSTVAALVAMAGLAPPTSIAQDADPAETVEQEGQAQEVPAPIERGPDGRRVLDGPPTTLSFRGADLDDLIPFLVEATGKVVIVPELRLNVDITLMSDEPIPQSQALDLVILALQQDNVAVVETKDIIILRDINEVIRQDVPVIGPSESVMDRTDLGTMAEKIYRISNSEASELAEALGEIVPDYAKVTVDEASNHIAVLGNIGLLRRVEGLLAGMDQPGSRALVTRTFRLRYADAELIAENITELFGQDGATTQGQQQGGRNFNRFFGRGGGDDEGSSGASTAELRVTANTQQNGVTVAAEQGVMDQIADLIESEWDLPLPEETVTPRIYTLENSDPIAVRDLLVGLFGEPDAAAGGGGGGGGQGNQGNQGSSGSSQGVGRLAGQFAFEAIPSAGQIAVVAKSPDNLAVIDQIIRDLDQPKSVGLPAIVSLKHVSAEEVAEQLNALLALDGTLATIPRSESGLSTGAGAGDSPFADDAADTAAADTDNDPGTITFWWQTAREQTDSAGPSNLIGKLRIVPVWRQNAIMVLSPPEYRTAVVDLIQQLDQPGRQVLIQAVIAEVSRDDAEALGLRWSSSPINLTRTDNSISFVSSTTASEGGIFGNLFDTSVLNVGVDLNAVLQALDERTDVSILSRPIIFTSDNQEAEFFDGQDIPFITNAQTTDTGGTTQGFEYRAVGIQLRVRPRLTPNKDVDLRVNIELSSVAPGQATASGQVVVDRRETTTQLIVRSGQTLVISGILRNEDSEVVRKVPLLGDIPLLGWLFRSRETGVSSTEQLIFITPVIVENAEEADAINEAYRLRLRMQREQMGIEEPLEGELLDDAEALDDGEPG